MLVRNEPERHRGEERRGRLLALPVERGGVAHLGDAGADGVEHFERRHHFAGGGDCYFKAAARKRTNSLGDALRRHARPGQALRPRRDHAPFALVALRQSRRCQRGGDARDAARNDTAARDLAHEVPSVETNSNILACDFKSLRKSGRDGAHPPCTVRYFRTQVGSAKTQGGRAIWERISALRGWIGSSGSTGTGCANTAPSGPAR